MLFSNKSIVVTGAGHGIGRELALAFAREGARVLVHYGQAREPAEETLRAIESLGTQGWIVQADLRETIQVQQLVATALEKLGSLDVWINNAGASANTSESQGLSEEERLRRVLEVDVMGTWRCCREVAPHIRPGGSILTVGWNHALDGAPGFVNQAYAVSKGAVISLTRCLARELAPDVRVNCIAPGWVENEWSLSRSESFRERATQSIPLGRWGRASDIAAAALFLASPAASFITGQVLLVDGGEVMR